MVFIPSDVAATAALRHWLDCWGVIVSACGAIRFVKPLTLPPAFFLCRGPRRGKHPLLSMLIVNPENKPTLLSLSRRGNPAHVSSSTISRILVLARYSANCEAPRDKDEMWAGKKHIWNILKKMLYSQTLY